MYAQQGQLELSLRWINAGLITDSHDRGMLTNLAYVQALSGEVVNSMSTLRQLRNLYGESAEPFVLATEGLLDYQASRFDEGDRAYDSGRLSIQCQTRPCHGGVLPIESGFACDRLSAPKCGTRLLSKQRLRLVSIRASTH